VKSEEIREAAQAVCSARKAGKLLKGLDNLTPASMDEGYAVQQAFMSMWDEPIVGWKVGATAPKVQEVYRVTEPFCGPFYGPTTYASPATPKASDFGHLCIESEFAFRFAKGLPARAQTYSREEILDAIETLLPALELISPRFQSLLQDQVALATADCGLNGGFVLGADYSAWRDLDLESHVVTLRVDGEVIAEGTGANVLGHPFNVLDWFVNTHARRCLDLKAGEIVSTGTCTGFHYIGRGQHAVADYGDIGTIDVTFI
jgi:2-keto-4-pentenoate hydratase